MHGRTASPQNVNSICGLTVDTAGSYMGTIKLKITTVLVVITVQEQDQSV